MRNTSLLCLGREKLIYRSFIQYYTITEDNARAVIGQYLLIIIPVNHMENVVIIWKQYATHFCGLLAQ